MELDVIQAQIDELRSVQNAVTRRIEELKKEAGITTDFEDELKSTMGELETLINDRTENEDIYALHVILHKLNGFSFTLISTLRRLSEY